MRTSRPAAGGDQHRARQAGKDEGGDCRSHAASIPVNGATYSPTARQAQACDRREPQSEGERDEGDDTGRSPPVPSKARIGPIADCAAAQRTEARRVADRIGAGGGERDGG